MRRVLLLAAARRCVALAAPAGAHPLGNFSVNHLTVVRASSDRVDVRYVLDQAEIPTFQERGLPAARVLARKRAEVARGVTLTVGGRPVALDPAPGRAHRLPPGRGGPAHDARRAAAACAGRAPGDGGRARRDLRRARRLARGARRARARDGGAQRRDERRPDAPPARLSDARCSRARPTAPSRTCSVTRGRPGPSRRRAATAPPGRRRPIAAPATASARSSSGRPTARASCCCSCSRRSAGAPCTPCRPGTARRWWRPTWWARAGPRATPSRWG